MVENAILLALVASGVSGAALFAITLLGTRVQAASRPISIAAGGMLLTLILLHIGPEAVSGSPNAWLFMLAGALLGLGLQQALRAVAEMRWSARPALESGPATLGQGSGVLFALAPLLAIALHSFLDGAVYGLAFTGGLESGIYAASALILHEVPEAFVAFALASAAGLSVRHAAIAAFAAATVTTPLGAVVSAPVLAAAGETAIPALFALSAGLLTYVALGPLLSPLYSPRDDNHARGFAPLLVGVVAAGLLMAAPLPHAHNHDHSGPVHAHMHEHAPGDGHDHPNFSPF